MAKATKEFIAARSIKLIDHPPYSPNLPADFFLFSKAKNSLAGTSISGSTVKKEWERVCSTISKDDYVAAFHKWVDRWERCIEREEDYVEK